MYLERNDSIIYTHSEVSESHKLKFIKEVTWGDTVFYKCKVVTKGWYSEVYLSDMDFYCRRAVKKNNI